MNREEYLKRLEELLSDISESERAEAVEFYRSYFEDAGKDQEESVIEALGTPEKLADSIRSGLLDKTAEGLEYGEKGIFDDDGSCNVTQYHGQGKQSASEHTAGKEKDNGWKIAFFVVLTILLFPLWAGIAGALFGILIGFVAVIFALVVSLGAIAAAMFVSGVLLFILSVVKCFTAPLAALLLAGISFVFLGLSILSALLLGVICVKFIPWLIRGFVAICQMPFRKRVTV